MQSRIFKKKQVQPLKQGSMKSILLDISSFAGSTTNYLLLSLVQQVQPLEVCSTTSSAIIFLSKDLFL